MSLDPDELARQWADEWARWMKAQQEAEDARIKEAVERLIEESQDGTEG